VVNWNDVLECNDVYHLPDAVGQSDRVPGQHYFAESTRAGISRNHVKEDGCVSCGILSMSR